MTPLEMHREIERLKLQKEHLADELCAIDRSDLANARLVADKTAQITTVVATINQLRQSLLRSVLPRR